MPFQKGNTLSPGGKKGNKGGRPSKTKQEIRKAAEQIAREMLEENIGVVMGSYLKLIKGRMVRRFEKGELVMEEEVIDSAAVRDAVKKVLPDRAPEDKAGNAVGPEYSLTIIRRSAE